MALYPSIDVSMSLPLVDVNSDTATATWPLLLSAISTADFIALDLELSGLGHSNKRSAIDASDRYKHQCDVVANYGILSMGVACFQWQPSSGDIQTTSNVEVFNIWLLSQHSYTIDPSSAKFLIDHGFDFNKQFRLGLPYTPAHANSKVKLRKEGCHLPTLFAHLLSAGCPLVLHNGLIDLLFLYSHFYASLPPKLDTFVADVSEMMTSGVYDTKAIAELLTRERASFLEYLFRKKQSENLSAAKSQTSPFLELVFHDYPSVADLGCVELVSLLPPPLPPLELLSKTQLCPTFTNHGYCHRSDCGRSHDVLLVIAVEEHKLEMAKAKRKRKKELQTQRKRPRTSSAERERVEKKEEESDQQMEREDSELTELFESDLSSAKARFTQEGGEKERGLLDLSLKPSFGHRAGFDAFMTGYSFASIAVTSMKPSDDCREKLMWLSGVEEMRNKLANRGRAFPFHVSKSHFTSTSQQHRDAQTNIEEFFKKQ